MITYKAITGHPNYLISECGVIVNASKNKIIRGHVNESGYPRVEIGRLNKYYRHRLVAFMWVEGRTEERRYVHHKDGDRLNFNALNLAWCTHKENIDCINSPESYYNWRQPRELDLIPVGTGQI